MAPILSVALLASLPGLARAEDSCRAALSQWDLEDLLIEAFEALEQPDNAMSSHCAFQLDLPDMTVPEAGVELGRCRWQGVEGETLFRLTPDTPDAVAVMRGAEVLAVLDLCDL